MEKNYKKQLNSARIYYLLWYILAGGTLSIIPLYAEEIGFTATQMGIFLAVPSFTMMLQPLWGAVIDKYKIPRLAVIIGIMGSAFFFTLMPLVTNESLNLDANSIFVFTTVIYVFATFFRAPVINTMDNIIFTMAAAAKYPFGKLRSWGSVSWGGAMLILSPFLTWFGTKSFFLVTLVGSFVVAYFVSKLPNTTRLKEQTSDEKPKLAVEAKKLLKSSTFVRLIIFTVVFAMLMPLNIPYTTLFMNELEAPVFLTSLVVAISTLPEILMMVKSEKVVKKLGISRTFMLASFFILLKYLIFSMTSSYYVVLLFCGLHGLGMGLYTPLIIRTVKLIVSDSVSVFAIMLIGFFGAIAGIISSTVAGMLREAFGFSGVFTYGAVVMSVAILILLITDKKQTKAYEKCERKLAA